jgi:hypothetical protein
MPCGLMLQSQGFQMERLELNQGQVLRP